MAKKSGRPRRFNKRAFLNYMQAGLSRNQVCEKLKISYGALEYHLRQDKYFQGKIYAAERKLQEEKRKQEREGINRDFEANHGYSLSYIEKLMDRVSAGEISEEDASEDAIRRTLRHRRILIKKRVPVLEVSNVDGDVNLMTWGEFKKASNIVYSEEELCDFDAYLKDLARSNPKKWGPSVKLIREWYKWHPEMQRFFAGVFMVDPITFRWQLRGPPSRSEVIAYIAQKEIEFEECRQERESFEKQLESLTMAQLGELNRELQKHINAAHECELNEHKRSISKNF